MKFLKRTAAWVLTLALVLSLSAVYAQAAPSATDIVTTPTGYKTAGDVVYKTYSQSGKTVIANWGARGEDCVFLSTYAQDYYTVSYDVLSSYTGGTTTSNTPSSQMYQELHDLMEGTHSFYTYYDGSKNVRDYYRYTDCVSSDVSQVALLYRGGLVTSAWNSGSIWNQEHVWPQSKLSSSQQVGDIMHLRPANPSENSSRGNKAFGESGGYYDPGVSVRGDCARIVLYMYVRWNATSTMWGSGGVMESLDVLLRWMEEDPVDTWEMGRNDAVQSVTGVRNVFVDYPELAWLMFGREVPEDMTTPSGGASDTPACNHTHTEVRDAKSASCTREGYTGDTYCTDCGKKIASGKAIAKTAHTDANGDYLCDACGAVLGTPPTDPTEPAPTDPTEPTPTDPTEPAPTDPTEPAPTDPTDPAPTDPTEPAPTDPTDPAPTDPTEPTPTEPTRPVPTDPTQPNPTDPSATTGGPQEPQEPQNPSPLWLALVLIAVAVIVVIVIVLIVKKKKKAE